MILIYKTIWGPSSQSDRMVTKPVTQNVIENIYSNFTNAKIALDVACSWFDCEMKTDSSCPIKCSHWWTADWSSYEVEIVAFSVTILSLCDPVIHAQNTRPWNSSIWQTAILHVFIPTRVYFWLKSILHPVLGSHRCLKELLLLGPCEPE